MMKHLFAKVMDYCLVGASDGNPVWRLVDFILHVDPYLRQWARDYGLWLYAILFVIVFCETGLVILPLLPGDSLIFTAGFLSADPKSPLSPYWLFVLMSAAAILGDTVNYWIGHKIGPRAFHAEDARFFKKKYLDRTHAFYVKYGGKTIVLARFIPIIRTFAPFVAGVAEMPYRWFIAYNVFGGFLWVGLFTLGGWLSAQIPWVEKHAIPFLVPAIIIISVMPPVIEYVRHRWRAARATARGTGHDAPEVPE